VVTSLFELMKELIDTRTNRGRFDAASMTGFILFKEISAMLLEYFKYVDMFQNYQVKSDKYGEKYFFIHCAVEIFHNCVAGNFVNYAVCEYYQDLTFVDLAKMIFTLLSVQNHKELASFRSLWASTYQMIELFNRTYLETVFTHFPPELILSMLNTLLQGIKEESHIKTHSCNSL
jgi:exportin-7